MNGRNLQIDGLRAVAMFMVVVFHGLSRFSILYFDAKFKWIDWFGAFGTTLFMMLSAFFLGKVPQKDSFKITKYFGKKILRLWPTYFVSITIIFIITHIVNFSDRMVSFGDFLLNIFFINGYIDKPYVDSSHWYMTTIVSFIFITGLGNWLEVKYSRSKQVHVSGGYILWMLLGFLSKIMNMNILYKVLGGSYIGIASIGGIYYRYINNYIKKEKIWDFQVTLTVIVSLAYTYATKGFLYCVYVLISLLLITLTYKKKLSFCQNNFLNIFGAASYSIYLIHQNLLYIMELELHHLYNYSSFEIWIGFLCCGLILLVGLTYFYIFEKPLTKLLIRKGML